MARTNKGKGTTTNTTPVAPATAPVAPTAPTPTPFAPATLVVTQATPANRRGTSAVPNPVGATWVYCHNTAYGAHCAGATMPTRNALLNGAMALGVTFYTARTQVNAYLKASANGTQVPTTLPRHVVL